jgi:L-malate glycosyltransferase
MSRLKRVMVFAGYTLPSEHRKIELLADAEDIEIVHHAGSASGRIAGVYPSANGLRRYTLRTSRVLGKRGDAHRAFGWPPTYGFTSFRPDLVHYEGEIESLGAAQIVVLRWLLARHAKLVLTTWQNILRPRGRLVRMLNGMNLAASQHVLCASEEAVTVLERQGYRGTCSVLPIVGVDTRTFCPKPVAELRSQLGLERFVVGYVGRLVPEKGLDTLLSAAAQAACRPQVLLVGNGPEKLCLQELAVRLGLGDRIRFMDAVPHEAVPDYMNLLDMLVLPSRTTVHWKEQFGRVLVEAMACRVAVAGSTSGAIPEVIGGAGRIFPEGDSSALAGIMDALAAEPTLRLTLAQQGHDRALSRYSIEHIASDTLAVWRRLLAPSTPL